MFCPQGTMIHMEKTYGFIQIFQCPKIKILLVETFEHRLNFIKLIKSSLSLKY